jgi:competence protein ComEC
VGPLVPLAVAFVVGVALAPRVPFGSWVWTGAALVALALGAVGPRIRVVWLRWPGLAAGFLCLGFQTGIAAEREAPAHHVRRLPESALAGPVLVEGWVARPPDPQPADTRDPRDTLRTRFAVEVTSLTLDGRRVPAAGRARLSVIGPPMDVRYGDEIRGRFRLRHPRRFENPGAFDYPAYLASRRIFLEGWTREPVEVAAGSRGSRLLGVLFDVRTLLLRRLDAAFPPAPGGLLKAVVLGDRSGLSAETQRAFLESGTYHILAISGLHVGILAGALFGFFRLARVSPRVAAAAAAVLVTAYAALAGAGASVVRAALMADVYLLAIVLDRRADLVNSLALAALALLWWNPGSLHDVGFQLTFLATLGIAAVLPRCASRLGSLPRPFRWALESVAITVAASAVTLPVLAGSFNRFAPVGVLANLPVVPLSGAITTLGAAACGAFLIVPEGLTWLNQINARLAEALLWLAHWFAGWPWSSLRVYTPTVGMILLYYGAIVSLLCAVPTVPKGGGGTARRWARWAAIGCCAILLVQVSWRLRPATEDGVVRVTMLDVGQGEAVFVEVPGRARMLVDAGGILGDGFDVGERVIAPFLWHEWVDRLDVLVLTHPQSDHIGGAATVLRTFPVGEVWTGASPALSPTDVWIQEHLRHRRIPHRIVAAGDPPARWGEAVVRVLHPGPTGEDENPLRPGRRLGVNDRSVVLRVQLGDQAILLTGDLARDGEAAVLRSGAAVQAQVLKVPHHGSRHSSSEDFVRAVGPSAALVSVGHRNPFRHPHPEVAARYEGAGARLWRTDRHGAIYVEMRAGETRLRGHREAGESSPEGGTAGAGVEARPPAAMAE